jgi:hypothetical protein
MIIDIIIAVLSHFETIIFASTVQMSKSCAYSDRVKFLSLSQFDGVLKCLLDWANGLAHGELFFIYLIAFKKFRRAFVEILKTTSQKCIGVCKKFC